MTKTKTSSIELSTEGERRRQEIREAFGENPQRNVQLELKVLREKGLLVDLEIRGAGMFSRTLTSVETGIADWSDDQRVSQYTKGSKLLGPQDKIKSIKSVEVSLRNNLEKYTFRVTGFSPYRWLPFTAYAEWRERHEILVAKLTELKRWLVDNRETWYDQLAVEFTNIAENVWTSLTAGKNTKDRTTQVYKFVRVNIDGTMQDLDHEKFVSYFVSNTMRQVPTAGQIEQSSSRLRDRTRIRLARH